MSIANQIVLNALTLIMAILATYRLYRLLIETKILKARPDAMEILLFLGLIQIFAFTALCMGSFEFCKNYYV